jgi:putative FmdB family regulatory protein
VRGAATQPVDERTTANDKLRQTQREYRTPNRDKPSANTEHRTPNTEYRLRGPMPLYEYQCDACAHRFEVIQKFSDPPVAACPTCGGAVQKLLSSPAIQFKGTGWYITDYARGGKTDSATTSAGDKPSASADGKSETKSETKTETKSETKTETKSESSKA